MSKRTVGLLVMTALIIAGCGGGEPISDEAPSTTTAEVDVDDPAATGSQTDDASNQTGDMGDTVHAAESDIGQILVDPDGFTLYVFTSDFEGESSCYGACASLWPPLAGDVAIHADLDSGIFGSTTRTDGSEQLTVNGMPLYRYTPDTNPGDMNGQAFEGVWFVVDAGGAIIETAAGGTDDTVIDYDYGYDY